jgi:DNA-directed RNA polymerase specialized sigma24 family protein
MLATAGDVIRSLVTYTDWWQPSSTSLMQIGAARRSTDVPEGFRAGLLESLPERMELSRRMRRVSDRDRRLLFLWYVQQLEVNDIAKAVGLSRRQCFRRRGQAIRALVDEAPQPHPDDVTVR